MSLSSLYVVNKLWLIELMVRVQCILYSQEIRKIKLNEKGIVFYCAHVNVLHVMKIFGLMQYQWPNNGI